MRVGGDKQKLHIDEESAKVVRRIFEMTIQGTGQKEIADILSSEKIPIPSAYSEEHHPESARHHSYHDKYRWSGTTVRHILDSQEYMGNTVLGKTICDNFKTKKRRNAASDELMIFEDTHEPIISRETWEKAQRLRKRQPRRLADGSHTHRLSGIVFCADCGARMTYKSTVSRKDGTTYDSDYSFQCGHYRSMYEQCTSHHIKASSLENAILHAVQTLAQHALADEGAFAEELKSHWEGKRTSDTAEDRNELATAKKRTAELDSLIRGLYEAGISGAIPERQVQRLMEQYDDEQIMLEKRISELEWRINETEPQKPETERFMRLIRKYTDYSELTDTMLYELIERIEIHSATGGRTRYRQQRIDIHFNFIGDYTPPAPIISEEERTAEIDRMAEEKAREKARRSTEREREKRIELRRRAETDTEALRIYEEKLAKRREYGKAYRQRKKESPEYQEYQRQKILKQNSRLRETRAELIERAKTDPKAAEELAQKRAVEAEKSRISRERKAKKAAEDKEYAQKLMERNAEYNRRQTAKRKAQRLELIERAKTDPKAAEELAKMRAKQIEASNKWRAKKLAQQSEAV
jgi:predicted RNA-binding Zn-ribbon protein involved in translation (DUF1610 family)